MRSLFFLLSFWLSLAANAQTVVSEHEMKAVYLFNLAMHTDWPENLRANFKAKLLRMARKNHAGADGVVAALVDDDEGAGAAVFQVGIGEQRLGQLEATLAMSFIASFSAGTHSSVLTSRRWSMPASLALLSRVVWRIR
jgi:hypothetical protein